MQRLVARTLAVPRALGLVLALVAACGARTDLPCFDEPCPTPEEEEQARAAACEVAQWEAPACTGSGLIATLEDGCIDDGGSTEGGDVLEIFCVAGLARFCLSHESCPWRSGGSTDDELTCSRGGLEADFMARTIHGCAGWEGHDLFCCSADGRIGLATR